MTQSNLDFEYRGYSGYFGPNQDSSMMSGLFSEANISNVSKISPKGMKNTTTDSFSNSLQDIIGT